MPRSTQFVPRTLAPPTWGLPLVATNAFWSIELKREHLPDLVHGSINSVLPLSPNQIANLSPREGTIIAIWRTPNSEDRTPLPQIILGSPSTLEDLFAWSATYLRGIGPITAQTRAITPDVFRLTLRARPENIWRRLAGGAVGMGIGEVLMHTRRATPLAGITLAACRSTLSFALMRAAALGIRNEELFDVAELWQQLRSKTGQASTAVPVGDIVKVATALTIAKLDQNSDDQSNYDRPANLLLELGGEPESLRRVGEAFGPFPTELSLEHFSAQTAETRVKLFDRLAPILIAHPVRTRIEKAFALAVISYFCRPGLPQQISLLTAFNDVSPESLLWLGAMQGAIPFPDTLAEGDGLGWRVARDLFDPADVFSAPVCDISLSELQVLIRGRSTTRMVKSLATTRLDVELMPGVSTFVRAFQPELSEQSSLPLELQTSLAADEGVQSERNSLSDELIADAEKVLAELSRFLNKARARLPDARPINRKRRR
jgi:hypothetical protein